MLKKQNLDERKISLLDASQLNDLRPSGGHVVIRKENSEGTVSVYLVIGKDDDGDNFSVIHMSKADDIFCKKNTEAINIHEKARDLKVINVWNLTDLKITKSFDTTGTRKEKLKQTSELWTIWSQ